LATKWDYRRGELTHEQFFEKKENRGLDKEYVADKTLAMSYLLDITRPEYICSFDSLISDFKDTELLARKAFLVEPT
jgi:hypothetical protein